jgi:alpha-L-arabinofuranosidase
VQGTLKSQKQLWLSFDEWNVWYRARSGDAVNGRRQFAPKLLEEEYNLEDALLVGGFLNSLLRRSDRVRVGCLAQIINVIAPLMTNNDTVLRQTIYYPYVWALKYAKGRVLDPLVASDTYPISAAGLREDFARDDQVPYLDVAVTLDEASGEASVFVLNRDLTRERDVVLDWVDPVPQRVQACETLTGDDMKAANTFDAPERVVPRPLDAPRAARSMTLRVPAGSYTVLNLSI